MKIGSIINTFFHNALFTAAACYGIPNDDGAMLEAAVITAAGCWSSIDNARKYSAIKNASLTQRADKRKITVLFTF